MTDRNLTPAWSTSWASLPRQERELILRKLLQECDANGLRQFKLNEFDAFIADHDFDLAHYPHPRSIATFAG